MSYCSWHVYGYGINVSDIVEKSLPRLQKMLNFAPDYQKSILNWFSEIGLSEPSYDDYMEFDQDYRLGLATILKETILEAEHIEFVSCDDFNGNTYLVYGPSYPWRIPNAEKDLTEEKIRAILSKYVSILTDETIIVDYQEIENGG